MLNQVILIGRVNQVKKSKGVVQSFHLDIERPDKSMMDSPIIKLDESLGKAMAAHIVGDQLVAVKAHIETEVKGGYGTIMNIIAERLTYLSIKTDEDGTA